MSIKTKRLLLLIFVCVLTIVCYIIQNRNYDPLARYPYEDEEVRRAILDNMDELEIKYICDYSISPDYFMDFIEYYDFNAFYSEEYYKAKEKLILLDDAEIISVVNRIEYLHLDFDACINEYQYMFYGSIMERLKRA